MSTLIYDTQEHLLPLIVIIIIIIIIIQSLWGDDPAEGQHNTLINICNINL